MVEDSLLALAKTFENAFGGKNNGDNLYLQAYQHIQTLKEENVALGIQFEQENAAVKHRAEVANRIAKQACSVIFTGEINGEHWTEKLRDYKREHGLIGYGLSPDMLYDCLREITEKELAEEGSNEKEGTRQVYRKRPRTGDNT